MSNNRVTVLLWLNSKYYIITVNARGEAKHKELTPERFRKLAVKYKVKRKLSDQEEKPLIKCDCFTCKHRDTEAESTLPGAEYCKLINGYKIDAYSTNCKLWNKEIKERRKWKSSAR